MTIVYTSHYMEEVEALCPRIGIIDHGCLVACDTVEHLLKLLPGKIVFRPQPADDALASQCEKADGVTALKRGDGGVWEVSCADVPRTLVRLLEAAKRHGAELDVLDLERPNLERVFLHLTGRALRD